jgi:GPH family glycoside/pentoside/hexuronide:cation symporter
MPPPAVADSLPVPGRGRELHLVTHIPPEDRVPAGQKILFSTGTSAEYVATGLTTGVLWMPYFNIGMGMSPAVVGAVLMLLRIWEAFSDPFIGNISDNARTRWGRRRPFIALGAVLTAGLFPLFWYMPAHWGEHAKAAYLVAAGMMFFTAFATWGMPYYGLQMELTSNYDERTRISSYMALFSKLSSLAGGWVMAFVTGRWFINPVTGRGDIVIGMRTGCWIISGVVLVAALCPALFVPERFYGAEAKRQAREGFWTSVQESARCAPLWALIGISFCLLLGAMSTGTLSQYLSIYLVFHGDMHAASVVAGWKNTVIVTVGILSIPLWAWLGERFDKKAMVIAMLAVSLLGIQLNYFCLRPDLPYLQIVPGVFEVGAYGALWLFLPSMKADVADWDESKTARRREGSINAFYSWFIKASLTCGVGVGAAVIQLSGFRSSLPVQPPEVLHRMMTLYLLLPALIYGLAILIACLYPLNRKSMGEIRAELESRRGKIRSR